MSTLTLKNVPPSLHERLKTSAAAHRRSLNQEAIVWLETAPGAREVDVSTLLAQARELEGAIKGKLTDRRLRLWKNQGRP